MFHLGALVLVNFFVESTKPAQTTGVLVIPGLKKKSWLLKQVKSVLIS